MLTYEEFVAEYPDYKGNGSGQGTQIAMVQKKLDAAWLEIDPLVWGAKANVGHGLLTAISLALTPFGKNAKLSNVQGGTVYDARYRAILRQVTGKARPLL